MRNPFRAHLFALFALVLISTAGSSGPFGGTARAGEVLDRVLLDGILRCGVTSSGPGLSEIGADGRWRGLFVDYCRAIAAGVLNDPEAVEYVEVNDLVRFDALRQDAFDVLIGNTTWTAGRDTALGITFAGVIYYDGQGFLTHRSLGISSIADVEQARVCVSDGTTTIQRLKELRDGNHPGLEVLPFRSIEGTYDAFFARECEMMTYDRLALVAQLRSRASAPENFILLPEVFSKEPLGPAVKRGDMEWLDVVRWTVLATVAAEEMGLTSANIGARANSPNPAIRRFLGIEGTVGQNMGLSPSWAANIIRHLGNYGEIFDRHVGKSSSLGLERGLNDLWNRGGLMYAPPIK